MPTKFWKRPFVVTVLAAGFAGVAVLPVTAQDAAPASRTIGVAFEPPEIPREAICAPSPPDDQLQAEWANWDGKALPARDPELIRRDLQRLSDIDAIRWFDTLEKAYALMPAADAKFGPEKAMLARVERLIAAGRLKELTSLQLVQQLMDSEAGNSPRLQNILSDYLMQGTGIAADKRKGLAMLIGAGYGGNADALLKIVQMQENGSDVPGWDVPQDIAVTMAFGALVGKLDPMICDRVARIAREYSNGTIVTRDVGLAEKWFRFAADMGDSASAWKVAEMHMRSEDIVKDNDILIDYLTKAADGGLPYAQVALGRAYEVGALVRKDLHKAGSLYAKAAAYGDRAAGLRNALFLQAQAKRDPATLPLFRAALEQLTSRKDAPSWAFIALGDMVLQEKGRWAGEAEAVALYEKAVGPADFDGLKRLTPIRFRYATTPGQFYDIVDQVVETVHLGGEIDPMNGLSNAFTCRAPDAPQRDEALYWQSTSAATASETVDFEPPTLLDLIAHPDARKLATLQSQALYGRASAMAQFMAYLDRINVPVEERQFWADYATRFEGIDKARGTLERKFELIGQNIGTPEDYFTKAIAEGDVTAGIDLAEVLLERDPVANAAAAYSALDPVTGTGSGKALQLLPLANPELYPDMAAVYAKFAPVIEARGDFDALMLALPFVTDPAQVKDYIRRATTVTDCSFVQVLAFAGAMGRIGDKPAFQKWLTIGEFLGGDDGWNLVQMADILRQYGDKTTETAQLDLYQRAFEGGNTTAIHRLLDVVSDPQNVRYDADRSADLYVALVTQIMPDNIPKALARLATAEPVIRANVESRIDLAALYLTAATAGNKVGMREYGKLLLASSASLAELRVATDWIEKAAEAGDVPAMVNYADALAFGIGTEVSHDEALSWLAKAADAGNADAITKMHSLTLQAKVSQ